MQSKKQHIIAFVLLAVYLPAMVAVSTHTHIAPAGACYNCVHHIAHPAHFSPTVPEAECLLCVLSATVYLPAMAVSVKVLPKVLRKLTAVSVSHITPPVCGIPPLRAPPLVN